MTVSVDLGSGDFKHNPFKANQVIGIDLEGVGQENLNCRIGIEPIPIRESSIDYVTAYDFVEHVPRVVYYEGEWINPFINMMNDIWKILKPGGIFYAETPAYPHAEAFQDPTHVNIVTENTINYFTGSVPDARGNDYGRRYGFKGKFKLNKQEWTKRCYLVWHLTAVK